MHRAGASGKSAMVHVGGVPTLSLLLVPENGKCSFIPIVNRGPMKPCAADLGLCLA